MAARYFLRIGVNRGKSHAYGTPSILHPVLRGGACSFQRPWVIPGDRGMLFRLGTDLRRLLRPGPFVLAENRWILQYAQLSARRFELAAFYATHQAPLL